MTNEILLYDDLNPYTGMRVVAVRRADVPVDADAYLEKVPGAALPSLTSERFEVAQKSVTWHFLTLTWAPRELIGFAVEDSRLEGLGLKLPVRVIPKGDAVDGGVIPAAAWTMEAGKGMEGAMLAAVTLYAEEVKFHPRVILVKHLPEAAEQVLRVGSFCFPIVQADWVWKAMVLVL